MLALPFVPTLPIHTQRLVLRAFQSDDLAALLEFHSRPDSVRYLPFDARDEASMAINLARKLAGGVFAADDDLIELAVTLAAGGQLIGDLFFALRSAADSTVEVGWLFHPAFAGRGYATEAARALLGLAFRALGAHRAIARVDARNERSLALCDRLGMSREATFIESHWFKGEWATEIHYGLLQRNFGVTRAG